MGMAFRTLLLGLVCVVLSGGCGDTPRPALGPAAVFSVAVDGSDLRALDVEGSGFARGPDGRIAFIRGSWPYTDHSWLAVMDDDGTDLHTLVRANQGTIGPEPPAWSSDGRLLALANGRACELGECEFWTTRVVDARTGARHARFPGADGPSWSSDGARIAFTRLPLRGTGDPHVAVARAAGRRARWLVAGEAAAWAPRGEVIAYLRERDNSLHVIRANGTGDRRLAGRGALFAWAPHGRRLAVVEATTLSVIELDGGRRTRIGAAHTVRDAPSWSPNGKRLAWVSLDARRDEDRLLTASADGSAHPRQLVRTPPGYRLEAPVFTASGERVLYSLQRPKPRRQRQARAGEVVLPTDALRIGPSGRPDEFAVLRGPTREAPCNTVEIRDLSGRLRRVFSSIRRGCFSVMFGWLAAAGERAIMPDDESSNDSRQVVFAIEARRELEPAHYYGYAGGSDDDSHFGGSGASGPWLIWGWWRQRTRFPRHPDTLDGECTVSCRYRASGGIERWRGGPVTAVPHAPPVWLLAAGDGLAAVDAVTRKGWHRSEVLPDAIQVLRLADGRRLLDIPHVGGEQVLALAVSRRWLVELAETHGDWRGRMFLRVRRVTDGAVLRSSSLEHGTHFDPGPGAIFPTLATSLSLTGNLLVIHDSETVAAVSLPAGRVRVVGRGMIAGAVALSNGRVVWESCTGEGSCAIHIARARSR